MMEFEKNGVHFPRKLCILAVLLSMGWLIYVNRMMVAKNEPWLKNKGIKTASERRSEIRKPPQPLVEHLLILLLQHLLEVPL